MEAWFGRRGDLPEQGVSVFMKVHESKPGTSPAGLGTLTEQTMMARGSLGTKPKTVSTQCLSFGHRLAKLIPCQAHCTVARANSHSTFDTAARGVVS